MTAEYFAHPALSRSDLLGILNNVELWRARKDGRIPWPGPTPSMVFGSALDMFLAGGKGPDPLPSDAVVIPAELLAKNGAKSTAAAKEFIAAHPGKQCLTPQEAERLRGEAEQQLQALMACEAQIRAHTMARRLLLDGAMYRQHAMFWVDSQAVLELKTLPDIVKLGSAVVDLKTSDDTSPRAFMAASRRYGYDIQAWMGREGWYQTYGDVLRFCFVVVRNKPPYDVEVYEATDAFFEAGEMRARKAMDRFQACRKSGKWRSPMHGKVYELEPPAWWLRDDEYEIETEDVSYG